MTFKLSLFQTSESGLNKHRLNSSLHNVNVTNRTSRVQNYQNISFAVGVLEVVEALQIPKSKCRSINSCELSVDVNESVNVAL